MARNKQNRLTRETIDVALEHLERVGVVALCGAPGQDQLGSAREITERLGASWLDSPPVREGAPTRGTVVVEAWGPAESRELERLRASHPGLRIVAAGSAAPAGWPRVDFASLDDAEGGELYWSAAGCAFADEKDEVAAALLSSSLGGSAQLIKTYALRAGLIAPAQARHSLFDRDLADALEAIGAGDVALALDAACARATDHLSEDDRRALAALALFGGAFDESAARATLEAAGLAGGLEPLAALVSSRLAYRSDLDGVTGDWWSIAPPVASWARRSLESPPRACARAALDEALSTWRVCEADARLGLWRIRRTQTRALVPTLVRLRAAHPNRLAEVVSVLCAFWRRMGESALRDALLTEAIELGEGGDRWRATLHVERGYYRFRRGQGASSREDFESARAIGSRLAGWDAMSLGVWHYYFGDALTAERLFVCAEREAREARETPVYLPELYGRRAVMHACAGRRGAALDDLARMDEAFRELPLVSGEDATCELLRGQCYMVSGDSKSARLAFRRAMQRARNQGESYVEAIASFEFTRESMGAGYQARDLAPRQISESSAWQSESTSVEVTARAAFARDDYEAARAILSESLERFVTHDIIAGAATLTILLAHTEHLLDHLSEAEFHYAAAAQLSRKRGLLLCETIALSSLCWVLVEQGRAREARLLAAEARDSFALLDATRAWLGGDTELATLCAAAMLGDALDREESIAPWLVLRALTDAELPAGSPTVDELLSLPPSRSSPLIKLASSLSTLRARSEGGARVDAPSRQPMDAPREPRQESSSGGGEVASGLPRLRLGPSGEWFELSEERVDLRRRKSLRSILFALVESNEPLSTYELFEFGWPADSAAVGAATSRVYGVIRELRALGLRDVIVNDSDGYRLVCAIEREGPLT